MLDLTGKKALVTGGAVGIGRGIALALAQAGADVAITCHRDDAAATVAQICDLGRTAVMLKLDATSSEDVDSAVSSAAAELGGRIDILVNNAGGLLARTAIADMADDHWHSVLDLNLSSAFYCVRAVLRHMPDGGRIINVSSQAARDGGGAGAVAYAAAKAGMHGLTCGLAKELAGRHITVNAVAPGFILGTPFHATFTPDSQHEAIIQRIPAGRAGNPEDVAGLVLYLASPQSAFVTGCVLDINGGAYFS